MTPLSKEEENKLKPLLDTLDTELQNWQASPTIRGIDTAVARLAFWNEAVSSVKIEGQSGSISELAHISRYGNLDETLRAATNKARSLAYVNSVFGLPAPSETTATDPEFLHDMHTIIMHKIIENEKLGEWRWNEVDILDSKTGEVQDTGTPAEELEDKMQEWSQKYHQKNWEDKHPALRINMAHLDFERIHPYADGNGRTGRALISAIALEEGMPMLPISKILEQHRDTYFKTLKNAIKNNSTLEWNSFMVESQIHAMKHLKEITKEAKKLVEKTEKQLPESLSNREKRIFALEILSEPVSSITQTSKRTKISPEIVKQAFQNLEKNKSGTLKTIGEEERFIFSSAIELAEKPYLVKNKQKELTMEM